MLRSETEREDFEDRILIVIHSSFSASSQDPSIEQIASRTREWSELLFGLIPADRIEEVFRQAFRDKPNDFPVNAYDLKNTWQKMQIEEQTEKERAEEQRKTDHAIALCENRKNHWRNPETTQDEGLVEFQEGFDTSTVRLGPCPYCRRKAFEQRQAEFIESKKGAGVPKAVASVISAAVGQMDMNRVKRVQDDGREFLSWCTGQMIEDYKRAPYDDDGLAKILKYPLLGKIWRVPIDGHDLQEFGTTLHNAIEYIRLGAERYAEIRANLEKPE